MTTRPSGGLSAAAITVSAACLGVSAFQGGAFIHSIIQDPLQGTIMIAGIVSILIGSQVIARMCGLAIASKAPGWAVVMALMCIGAVETLSIATSTTAFSGNLIQSERSQNLDSPEYRMAMKNIENYQRQIDTLSVALAKMPENYVTKRREVSKDIRLLQRNMERIQRDAGNISVSVAGQAFDGLENNTGLSAADISFIAAALLSAVPLCLNVLAGSFGWRQSRVVAGKKSKGRPKLRSVA